MSNYAHILKISAQAIKSSDPTAKVVMSGMPDIGQDTKKLFEKYYLQVLKRLDNKYVDIFDFHLYGDAKNTWKIIKDIYKMIRQGLNSIGYKNIEIWITEIGTYSGKPHAIQGYAPFQTEKEQAIDLVRRMLYPLTFGIKKVFWAWGVIDCAASEGPDGYMGLLYNGNGIDNPGYGVKKLSYYTFKKMIEVLKGSDWNNIQTISETEGIYIYKFVKKDTGEPIWIVWNDNLEPKNISVTIGNAKEKTEVVITELVPKYKSGKEVIDYLKAFREIKGKYFKNSSGRSIAFEIKDKPVFIKRK